ncbi:hypothetical protein JCM19237_1767 [Photobacterium aphoticum]|uniref:Uncharacterized protein n=1 Tax=Photobacterium aphoticum TaxID=754436 RepID=A0A090REZ0_9GAMM|nr:hypothetical protein JCM19237_1767 [Photobacterium aphoticum]
MNSQKGMATLLVTVMLVVVSLLFSLASYKNVFYQIKRTQNEVEERQLHWRAEGGLECAIALNNHTPSLGVTGQPYDTCDTNDLTLTASLLTGTQYLITSTFQKDRGQTTLYKKIKTNPRTTGAIQAISDLKLVGSYTIKPDVDGPLPGGKFKCVSVRYGANFFAEGAVKVNDPAPDGPYPGFSGQCGVDYATDTETDLGTTNANIDAQLTPPVATGPLRLDFVKDLNMNPFESFFYRPREEIAEVKSEFTVITGSIDAADTATTTRCDTKIKQAFEGTAASPGTDKVWVEGNCDLLDGAGLNGFPETPRVLVVENGILASYGAAVFNGVVYHLTDPVTYPITDLTNAWTGMTSGNTLAAADKVKGVYYQAGSFRPTGGLVLDTRGGLSILRSGFDLTFVGGLNPNNPPQTVYWVEGSWNDI